METGPNAHWTGQNCPLPGQRIVFSLPAPVARTLGGEEFSEKRT